MGADIQIKSKSEAGDPIGFDSHLIKSKRD